MDKTAMKTYWAGSVPVSCDACGNSIIDQFADIATKMGPWGRLCPQCALTGPGIGRFGPGLGQLFTKQSDGRWLKTQG